jgi:threonyl-tRNA synthetase
LFPYFFQLEIQAIINLLLPYFRFSVVGEKERSNGTLNVRTRDNKVHGEQSIESVIDKFKQLAQQRILNSEEFGWGAAEK